MNIPPVPRGLTARISGFHPGGPGSTPGVGRIFIIFPLPFSIVDAETWVRQNVFKLKFRYRELNPGHLGESQVS